MAESCSNCQRPFDIEPEDTAFYERITVPPPTWCPECRFMRRLIWRNVFNFYKRPCDLCGKDSISIYPKDAPYRMYCPECWWSDDWDPMVYGRDYDETEPFFDQFRKLLREVPLLGLSYDYPNNINSPYVNECGPMKNSSLVFYGENCEEAMVGYYLVTMTNSLDTSLGMESQWMYDSRNVFRDNRCIAVYNTNECIDSAFLQNCRNCQHCFGSANLRNKKYVYFNEQLSKEAYEEKIKQHDLGSYAGYRETMKKAQAHWATYPPRPIWLDMSVDTTGNYTFESKNCKECYEVQGAEDSKYLSLMLQGPNKNCMDVSAWGNNMELCYEGCSVGENVSRLFFCQEAGLNSTDCEYSKLFINSSNLFGCISLRKKKFCILNKQYSPAEYKKLVAKIKAQMSKDKEYGEFFPMSLSPHAYNETLAQEFFPLTKDKATAKGYRWLDPEKRDYKITLRASELPDHIADTTPLVLKNIIECEKCQRGYRVTQMEFDFLKQLRLPLPRFCPFCRVSKKVGEWVRQLKLVDRTCDSCKKEFKTPYTKEEYEHILCKDCWAEEYS